MTTILGNGVLTAANATQANFNANLPPKGCLMAVSMTPNASTTGPLLGSIQFGDLADGAAAHTIFTDLRNGVVRGAGLTQSAEALYWTGRIDWTGGLTSPVVWFAIRNDTGGAESVNVYWVVETA